MAISSFRFLLKKNFNQNFNNDLVCKLLNNNIFGLYLLIKRSL